MNKFIGIGRLTNDNELKETSTGKYYLKNSLAIKNDYKNSNGEYDTEFAKKKDAPIKQTTSTPIKTNINFLFFTTPPPF